MRLASRIGYLLGEGAFEVLVRARALEAQGRDVVHMEIGEPDFPTPANIVAAGQQALADGYTKYGPTQGDPELRQAIAEQSTAHMSDVLQIVQASGALDYTLQAALTQSECATERLRTLPDNDYRDALRTLTNFCVDRLR